MGILDGLLSGFNDLTGAAIGGAAGYVAGELAHSEQKILYALLGAVGGFYYTAMKQAVPQPHESGFQDIPGYVPELPASGGRIGQVVRLVNGDGARILREDPDGSLWVFFQSPPLKAGNIGQINPLDIAEVIS